MTLETDSSMNREKINVTKKGSRLSDARQPGALFM